MAKRPLKKVVDADPRTLRSKQLFWGLKVVDTDIRTLRSKQLFGGCEDRDGLPGTGDF